jgi:hypothetical protein
MHSTASPHSPLVRDNNNPNVTAEQFVLPLIRGTFSKSDALDLIAHLVHVKVRFHEERIRQASSEEDIKMRESRIKELQRYLFETRESFRNMNGSISIESLINIRKHGK